MNRNSSHIIFCSSSYYEYDRRMQRITTEISNMARVKWVSRQYNLDAHAILGIDQGVISCYFKSGVLFYFEFNLRLLIYLLKDNSNIISSVDLDTLPAAYLASRLRSKILVFDAHEIFHEVPELEGKRFKKWIWKRLSKSLFQRIKHKYTVNEALQSLFKKEFNTHFGIIRNVPKTIESEQRPQMEYKRLVYLGVLNKGRGIEIALNALKDLPDYTLTLLGKGDLYDELLTLAKALKVEDRVEFLGYVAPDNINTHLSTASIGLNMLTAESLNYKLSLANKFFDYMHVGLPSINMNYPEYSNIMAQIHECGLLVDEYTSEALVKAVKRLEDSALYERATDQLLLRQKRSLTGKMNPRNSLKFIVNLFEITLYLILLFQLDLIKRHTQVLSLYSVQIYQTFRHVQHSCLCVVKAHSRQSSSLLV